MMPSKLVFALLISCSVALQSCAQTKLKKEKQEIMENTKDSLLNSEGDSAKLIKTEEEWKKILPSDVYQVARLKGTERPFTSKFENSTDVGTYYCKACGNALFLSDTKFESGCGWPSFYKPVTKNSVLYETDQSHGMTRTEVMCGKCKSHLGHVFDDGPPPTGLRYCINGVILDFTAAQKAEKKYNEEGKKQ